MGKQLTGAFEFESREAFEQAEKEAELIQRLLEQTDISEPKTALKVYNKSVSDKLFSTVSGYFFLMQLRQAILESGLVTERALAPIPIKEPQGKKKDVIPSRPPKEGRFRKLYEGQKLLNKKLKIAVVTLVLLIIGFVVINFQFEYSIFTYFTNYKANMEEELVNKYEKWEEQLKAREDKIEQSEKQGGQ